MPQKNFSETRVAQAMLEMAEDRIADAIKHMKDVTTVDGKPCEVNLKITITPNTSRDQFNMTVTGGAKLSPRHSAQSTLFAEVASGEVEFSEFDPKQRTIFDQ